MTGSLPRAAPWATGMTKCYPHVASSRSVGVTVCSGAAQVTDKGMSGDQRRERVPPGGFGGNLPSHAPQGCRAAEPRVTKRG